MPAGPRASGLSDEQRKADLAALGLSKLKQRKHASTQLEALLRRGEQSNPPIVLSECVRYFIMSCLLGLPTTLLGLTASCAVGLGIRRQRSGRQRLSGWPRSCRALARFCCLHHLQA